MNPMEFWVTIVGPATSVPHEPDIIAGKNLLDVVLIDVAAGFPKTRHRGKALEAHSRKFYRNLVDQHARCVPEFTVMRIWKRR